MSINYTTNNFGDVTFDGLLIHLTEYMYVNNYGTGIRYYAHGVTDDGTEYLVAWDTTAAWDAEQEAYRADFPDYEPLLSEDEACDWSEPVAARKLGPSA